MPREVSQERLMKDVKRVLENPFWITDLKPEELYQRLHDDHDGSRDGKINVTFSGGGDAWVDISHSCPGSLRFRTEFGGGGMSPRVRNALMILAYAIKLDNEARPQ